MTSNFDTPSCQKRAAALGFAILSVVLFFLSAFKMAYHRMQRLEAKVAVLEAIVNGSSLSDGDETHDCLRARTASPNVAVYDYSNRFSDKTFLQPTTIRSMGCLIDWHDAACAVHGSRRIR